MFPINLFEPKRGLVVHLVVGIHVADVAVVDQVHVTKLFFNSTNVGVSHVASRALPSPNIFFKESESEQILTIVSLQFKTGVRMLLTSQIKELGAILQKLIKV